MATLQDVFQKIAQAQPLDGQEEALWLAFLNRSEAVDYKVGAMAVGQSTVTALSQISNNAGRLTNGEYISPADPNVPYPEDENFTGVVQDSDGIRGINTGVLQFELRSEDGKAYAGAGAVEIDEDGISFPQGGSDGVVWGSLTPELNEYGASLSSFGRGLRIMSWQHRTAQLLSPVDFSNGFTGWTLSTPGNAEIATLPQITGNLAHATGIVEFTQARVAVSAGDSYLAWARVMSPDAKAFLYIKWYDSLTGGTLISQSESYAEASSDFITFSVLAKATFAAPYAEVVLMLLTGAYASNLSFSKVYGTSLYSEGDANYLYGRTTIYGSLEIESGQPIYSTDFVVQDHIRFGEVSAIDDVVTGLTGLFAKTDSELYKKNGTTEKRILTEDDVREKLTANRTYYVRTDGSDSNDGLANTAGGAFLTIPKAITEFRKLDTSVYNTTIKLGNGTYALPVEFADWLGSGELTIEGDTTTPSNVVISTTSASAMTINSTLTKRLTLKGFRLQTTTSGNCLIVAQPAQVEISALEFHTCAGHHIVLSGPCNLTAVGNYAITGSPALSHIEFSIGAKFACEYKTVTLTGTPNFPLAFVYGWRTGVALFAGTTYSGSATGQRYSAITNAVIDTGGGGASHLPGDSAGATATGGQYV